MRERMLRAANGFCVYAISFFMTLSYEYNTRKKKAVSNGWKASEKAEKKKKADDAVVIKR